MITVEVRPSEGGADAEGFAVELTEAISRALSKEDIRHERFEGGISVIGVLPHWL